MGCGGSKDDQKQPAAGAVIGAPQSVQIHIPRNRANEYGVPLQQVSRDIDNRTLMAALDHVSTYIANYGQRISVIAVGGAVNTLYLRSRVMTHDIDVFGSDLGNQARILLDAAMQDAQRYIPGLGTDWLNTETQMWMPGPLHHELTQNARRQNVRVFDGEGLRVYAAPWSYAFSAKINRILVGGGHLRPYDLDDAVTYIHAYIRSHQNQPVPVATALGWARHYHHESNEHVLLGRVNTAYHRRYNAVAFE